MRWVAAIILPLSAVLALCQQPQPPRVDPMRARNPTPREQVKAAAAHLRTAAAAYAVAKNRDDHDGPENLWYLDFGPVAEADLDAWVSLTQWWLNQMSFESAPAYMEPVNARLYVVNILDYRWNRQARDVVGSREVYTDAAWCDETDVLYLQKTMGIEQRKEQVDRNLYPVMAVVNAQWLVRETSESNRSQSYYDLLFAEQRFGRHVAAARPQQQPAVKVLVERGGVLVEVPLSEVRQGERPYTRVPGTNRLAEYIGNRPAAVAEPDVKAAPRAGANFPANVRDWDDAFGIDVARDFGKKRRIDTTYGAVSPGSSSDPLKGSIVALNDRLVFTQPTAFGSIGMRTFDFLENTGKRDPVERAPDLPFDALEDKVGEDAGELLAYLPNGGQAALLINAQKNRVEVADPLAAQDSISGKHRAAVRNPGSCVVCHGPDGGYILPRNLLAEMLKSGIDLKVKDREKFNRFRSFYESWQENVQPFTAKYLRLLAKTTRNQRVPGDKGWTGPQLGKEWSRLLGDYDKPVTAAIAARHSGYEENLVKLAAADAAIEVDDKGKAKNARGRLSMLNRGLGIPRRTYEVDVHRQLQLQFVKGRVKP